jgi:ankyrin repeat protein
MFRIINVIRYIIDCAGTHVDTTKLDSFKHTPLHRASSLSDETIINYLLGRKADVNGLSAENRYTPLHYATMKNFPGCIKCYIKLEAICMSMQGKKLVLEEESLC